MPEDTKAPKGVRHEDIFVPKSNYLSREFAALEAEHLWPRVWQVACREEEIPNPGDFITYDILDDTIVVVRNAAGGISAFHNVCPHRGRTIVENTGQVSRFVCRYHGWSWDLTGANTGVVDKGDWAGCLSDEDVRLKPVKAESWGGFVFINMDLNCEPLDKFLGPVKERCDKFEFEKLRFRWYRTMRYPCNWKVALEGFNEAYHVQQTHPQFLNFLEDYTVSDAYGLHGAFWYPPLPDGEVRFKVSSRLNKPSDPDTRKYVIAYAQELHEQIGAMVTPRSYEAAKSLMTELDETASGPEVLQKYRDLQRAAAEADGAGWPDMSPDYYREGKQDWHVFPNLIYLHSAVDGVLCYRARPDGDNPESCIYDVWALERFAPGAAPPLKREVYDDYRQIDWGRVLNQDFANLKEVQKGMKSRGFKGSLTNPVQERAVSNFHRALREFIAKG